MFELIEYRAEIDVKDQEFKRLLGFPSSYELSGRSKELVEWAKDWYKTNGRPWFYLRQVGALNTTNGQVAIDDEDFSSPRLHAQLTEAKAESAVVVAVSAGRELEEEARKLWNEEKPDEYFFLEVYGSAVVERLLAGAAYRLCEWADNLGKAVLPHYSPGYPGWGISDQYKLLTLIQKGTRHPLPADVQVLSTGMLVPKKSLLAVFGITSSDQEIRRITEMIPCENCSLDPCQFRLAPYRRALPQIENVRQLQARSIQSTDHSSIASLSHPYSVSIDALKKWSRDRLQLRILENRSVEARFRYEGTTCTNLGRLMEFDYHVRLGSHEEGYRILEARCFPAPGDTGHRFMCRYIEDAAALMNALASEKPLVGKPLSHVFEWNRHSSPTGCHCDSRSRDHKWGLVFEVLHYSLVGKNTERE